MEAPLPPMGPSTPRRAHAVPEDPLERLVAAVRGAALATGSADLPPEVAAAMDALTAERDTLVAQAQAQGTSRPRSQSRSQPGASPAPLVGGAYRIPQSRGRAPSQGSTPPGRRNSPLRPFRPCSGLGAASVPVAEMVSQGWGRRAPPCPGGMARDDIAAVTVRRYNEAVAMRGSATRALGEAAALLDAAVRQLEHTVAPNWAVEPRVAVTRGRPGDGLGDLASVQRRGPPPVDCRALDDSISVASEPYGDLEGDAAGFPASNIYSPLEVQQCAIAAATADASRALQGLQTFMATHLTKIEKRHLGLNAHRMQTAEERASTYQYYRPPRHVTAPLMHLRSARQTPTRERSTAGQATAAAPSAAALSAARQQQRPVASALRAAPPPHAVGIAGALTPSRVAAAGVDVGAYLHPQGSAATAERPSTERSEVNAQPSQTAEVTVQPSECSSSAAPAAPPTGLSSLPPPLALRGMDAISEGRATGDGAIGGAGTAGTGGGSTDGDRHGATSLSAPPPLAPGLSPRPSSARRPLAPQSPHLPPTPGRHPPAGGFYRPATPEQRPVSPSRTGSYLPHGPASPACPPTPRRGSLVGTPGESDRPPVPQTRSAEVCYPPPPIARRYSGDPDHRLSISGSPGQLQGGSGRGTLTVNALAAMAGRRDTPPVGVPPGVPQAAAPSTPRPAESASGVNTVHRASPLRSDSTTSADRAAVAAAPDSPVVSANSPLEVNATVPEAGVSAEVPAALECENSQRGEDGLGAGSGLIPVGGADGSSRLRVASPSRDSDPADPPRVSDTGSALAPPATDPPAADPPVADPPAADPPVADPPAADPPVADPPAADSAAAEVPVDQAVAAGSEPRAEVASGEAKEATPPAATPPKTPEPEVGRSVSSQSAQKRHIDLSRFKIQDSDSDSD